MKKTILIIFTFIYLFSTLVFTSTAANEVQLSINDITVNAGDSFTIDVMISDNSDLAGAVIDIKYNNEYFTFLEGTVGGIVSEAAQTDIRNIESSSCVRFTYMSSDETVTSSGILFSIKFLATDNAKGDSPFDLKIDYPADFVNSDSEKILYSLDSAKVTVKNYAIEESVVSEDKNESAIENSIQLENSETAENETESLTAESKTESSQSSDNNKTRIIVTVVCACLVLILLILLFQVIFKDRKRGEMK